MQKPGDQFKDILPEHRMRMLDALKIASEHSWGDPEKGTFEEFSLGRYRADTGEVMFTQPTDDPATHTLHYFNVSEDRPNPRHIYEYWPKDHPYPPFESEEPPREPSKNERSPHGQKWLAQMQTERAKRGWAPH